MRLKQSVFIVIFGIALTIFSLVFASLMMNSLFTMSVETQQWLQFSLPILLSLMITIGILKPQRTYQYKAPMYHQ